MALDRTKRINTFGYWLNLIARYGDRMRSGRTLVPAGLRHRMGLAYSWHCFEERNCVFIHIPRAAGLSMSMTLYDREVGHRRIRDVIEYGGPRARELFSFTFVRNPWDRLVSAYFFLKAGGMGKYGQDRSFSEHVINQYSSFDEFVREWINHNNVYKQIHFVPQVDFVLDNDGKIGVDFIGRFESLAEDFRTVAERVGTGRKELLNINKTDHSDYRSYFSAQAKTIVAEVYGNDIELFRYRF